MLQPTEDGAAKGEIGGIRSMTKEHQMNTFSASPTMTLNLARYTPTSPAEQTQARATLRAIKAEQRAARVSGPNPWTRFVRRFKVLTPTPSQRPASAH